MNNQGQNMNNQGQNMNNQGQNMNNQGQKAFDIQKIFSQIQQNKDISIHQVHNEMKELKMNIKQIVKDLMKVKKQIQLRPSIDNLTANTILINTTIQHDPSILKLLTTKQNQKKHLLNQRQSQNDEQLIKTQSEQQKIARIQNDNNLRLRQQYKQASFDLGRKLSQLSDSLPLILSIIKNLQKQTNTSISLIQKTIQQRMQSISQQFNSFKDQQITQRLSINQRIEQNYYQLNQKVRQFQVKQIWETKDIKNKLQDKIDKRLFQQEIHKQIQTVDIKIQKFQNQSVSLVNPQKIKQIQTNLTQNKKQSTKKMLQCELNISSINQKITNSLVSVQFYRKQRTSLQRRISTTTTNFQQFFAKVNQLLKSNSLHQMLIKETKQQNIKNSEQILRMKTVLENLNITQDFQKMLSQIDPQQILRLQTNIHQLSVQNKNVYKQIAILHQQLSKVQSKFDISGILIPNKARQKQFQTEDLKKVIDFYFTQNRYSHKIDKLQSQIVQAKTNVQNIKLLQRKIDRIQKQTNTNHLLEQFRKLQHHVIRQLKVNYQKVQKTLLNSQINKNYIKGITSQRFFTKHGEKQGVFQPISSQSRNSLLSQSSRRLKNTTLNISQLNSGSRRKSIPIKQLNSSIHKNTISSSRKSLLKSTHILLSK